MLQAGTSPPYGKKEFTIHLYSLQNLNNKTHIHIPWRSRAPCKIGWIVPGGIGWPKAQNLLTLGQNIQVSHTYVIINVGEYSGTSWFEHFPIQTHLASKFNLQSERKLSIRTFLPVGRLFCHEHLSLLWLVNGFQVTPAPSCLAYSSPQPWSLPAYHPIQCSFSGHW